MSLWTLPLRISSSLSFLSENKRSSARAAPQLPGRQHALLLHGPHQEYKLSEQHPIPTVAGDHELLVRVRAIGLNPIDWKAPDYNFGIPYLPYLSGRELCGEVIQAPRRSSRIRVGDTVIVISTDYRDPRKAAYQEYAVVADYNAARPPRSLSKEAAASIGVAFVASAIALGVCMGFDFSDTFQGPNLLDTVAALNKGDSLPKDVRNECIKGNQQWAKRGDWLVIWGGSSTTANLATQLARLAGLKVICVTDVAKHGRKVASFSPADGRRADCYVDSHDPVRAIAIIRTITKGTLRFALDTQGKDTAGLLLGAMEQQQNSEDAANGEGEGFRDSHLVGLTGLPRGDPPPGVRYHTVPIKLFHEVQPVGEALMQWLEVLLGRGAIVPPDVVGVHEGFEAVNSGLHNMRRGEVSWGRLVVRV